MQVVHVIPPKGLGDRHEEKFPDSFTPEEILAAFRQPRTKDPNDTYPLQFGYGVIREDPNDEFGVCYLDHPGTRVVIGKLQPAHDVVNRGAAGHALVRRNDFVEIQTIQGADPCSPAASSPTPAASPTSSSSPSNET